MKTLVDTSVWIEHLKKPVAELVELLSENQVLVHPLIIGELSCGNLKKRNEFLENLKLLPRATESSFEESLELIEENHFFGKGLGFTDIQLLASALLSEASLFTFDKPLKSAARGILNQNR